MKIKRSPKKNPSTNPAIAAFILQISSIPADELPSRLLPIIKSGWTWPRTDLQHWIKPLDRFDGILEEVINDYDLATMEHCQINAFTPRTRELLAAILGFEKVLLENSTNKKIYNSYDRINDLLHTTDVTILLAALRLGLRPAQQYSSSGASQGSFGISENRLLNLTQGWGTREYGLDMVDLAAPTLEIPAGLEEVEWQFYKKALPGAGAAAPSVGEPSTERKDKGKEVDLMDVEDEKKAGGESFAATSSVGAGASMGTPAPKPRASFAVGALLATPIPSTPYTPGTASASPPTEGLTNVPLGNVRLSPKSAVDILVDAIETYGIPEPERLNLLQKIRIGKALGSADERREMLVVRLLAIAVFAHTSTESSAQTKLFLYEPELIPQLAELVHPDRDVAIEIQVAAFYALDALARFKSKLSEVASSLNASVSHGILMYVIRRTVADLEKDNPVSTPDFIDALFNILSFFQTSAFVGNMIVGAGIVSVLVDFVKNQRRERVSVVTKAIVFLDGLMYGYSSAFTMFVAAGGLAVFVERVKDEIEICIAAHSGIPSSSKDAGDTATGLLSFEQAALLKALLRAIQRLMQTAGTTEGMRNLIDSTLLASVKNIIHERVIFGPQIFGLAINITATFIHNEPTCLTTIQEAKVPDTLYDALEEYIPASIDVLQAIPNAIGALCLNPAGLAQFNTRSIISKYFEIFSSPTHVRVLSERDNGNMIGTSIDELIRHHPSLKDQVLTAVYESLVTIRDKGRAFVPTTKVDDDQGFSLEAVVVDAVDGASGEQAKPGTSDVEMADVAATAVAASSIIKDEDIMNGVDVMGRFLEGLFQNISHCKDFIKLAPFAVLLDLLALPCAPSITPGTASFASIAAVFRVFCEARPTEVATAIMKHVKLYLAKTKEIWSPFSGESRLVPLVTPSSETLSEANQKFRDLSGLLTFVSLLSDIYSNFTYAHGKTATTILVILSTKNELEGLQQLGQLFQVSVLENILLNFHKKKEEVDSMPATAQGNVVASPVLLGGLPAPVATGVGEASVTPIAAKAPSTVSSRNRKAIQDVVSSLSPNITTLFQATIKLLLHRRSTEVAHRKAAAEVAATLASIMVENLRWPESSDLAANLSYVTAMIGSASGLLFEDRSNPPTAQMLLLIAFEKARGITALTSACEHLVSNSTDLISESEELSVGIPVVQTIAGLKAVLTLFRRLTSHQSILESPQTGLLLNREKDKSSPDYFDPHAFIIKLRAAILPSVAGIWDIPWIRRAPTTLVRTLVATLVNVLRAEGESSTDPFSSIPSGIFPSAALPLAGMQTGIPPTANPVERLLAGGGGATVLDQARVTQLIDMGFPRTAVESALTRCRNNVGIATEYLLQHPDVVGAARIAEAEAASRALAAGALEAPAVPVPAPAPAADAEVAAVPAVEAAVPAPEPVVEADVEMAEVAEDLPPLVDNTAAQKARESENLATKVALDTSRKEFEPTFLPRALSLAEQYPDLVFDIKRVFSFLGGAGDKSAPVLKPVLDGLFSPEGSPAGEDAVAIRLRVIALLAADATYRTTIETSREELMKILVAFEKVYAKDYALPTSTLPKWLSPMMLIADCLLSLSEVPVPSTILAADAEIPSPDLVGQGPAWVTERKAFFELVITVLVRKVTDREVFISTLRLLLILTRDHDLAVLLVQRDGLRSLFSAFDEERPETEGCRSYVTMILRHVLEEKAVLLPIMEREIEAWFAPPKSRVADMTAFLRGASSVAFRNIPLFIEAAKATCKLVQADASGHYHVALQREPQPTSKPTEAAAAIKSPLEMEGSAPTSTEEPTAPVKAVKASLSPTTTTDSTIHFLMSQIMEKSKLALAPAAPTTTVPLPVEGEGGVETPAAPLLAAPAVVSPAGVPKSPSKDATADVPLGDFYQTAFSMNLLAEMISSYPNSKASFLSFSTRRDKESSNSHHKRSSFLHYLLNDLLHTGTIVSLHDFDSQRRMSISTCATLVIIALCHDPDSSASPTKEPSPEVSIILKTVFDAIAKAFKEATTSSEPTDIRYSRLLALSDLCYRLLTSRPYPSISRPRDDTSMQLAKLMLEKNFAVILTNALADVDLNFPSVNNLINSILRPLEQLTKVVTKVGRAKGSVAPAGRPDEDPSSDASSFDEGEEMEADTEEEEAPDLYRNSALGMYEGELEPGHQEDAYMTGDSEEDYGEEDDMMDLEDGVIPDSDLSDVSDDEDNHEFAHDHEHDDMSDDEDEDEDGDSEGDDSDSEDDDDDELELDETDGEEIMIEGGEDLDEEGDDEGWVDEGGDEDVDGGGPDGAAFFDQVGNGGPLGEEDPDSGESEDEEEMYFEGALELDMEMTEQLNAQDARAGGGFGWDSIGNGETGVGRRNRLLADDMMGMGLNDSTVFGRPRPAAGVPNTATHPLLSEAPPLDNRTGEAPSRRQRGGGGPSRGTPEYNAWVESIEAMIGVGGVEALEELLHSHGLSHLSGTDQIRVQVGPGPDGGPAMFIDPSPAIANAQAQAQAQAHSLTRVRPRTATTAARTSPVDRIGVVNNYLPVTTVQRWQEEIRITQGAVLPAERVARLVNHIINVLHPAARAIAAELKSKAEEAKRLQASNEAAAAERRISGTPSSQAPQGAESSEAPVVSPSTEVAVVPPASNINAMEGLAMDDDIAEVMNLARSLAAALAPPAAPAPAVAPEQEAQPEGTPSSREDREAGHDMDEDGEGDESHDMDEDEDEEEDEADEEHDDAPADAGGASGSGVQGGTRVVISIHGQDVDITDTGIDPTFLEALPDDMREEVLNQHFRESRSAGPPPAVPSQINSEFLDALPPDLRAEVLRQEAAEQRREQAAARAASGAPGGAEEAAGPVEIDPASFLASLHPQLRNAVLLDQDEGFLATLPANLLAEANLLRDQAAAERRARRALQPPPVPAAGAAVVAPKKPAHREAIQLLEKSGLATLVRLLFFPQPLRKNSLQKVLVNLCENSRTRMELINLLLTILQDGTRDVSAVDKSFSQMSLRATKSLGTKETPRRKGALETPGGSLPHFPGESVPNLIAQRCLEALMFLCQSNDQASLFFLTEQEIVLGLGRRSAKKGKGKEKVVPSTAYPIVVLLGLLDRPALLKTQSMMDSLTQLLSLITKPLSILQKKPPPTDVPPQPITAPVVVPEEVSQAPSVSSASAAEPSSSDVPAPPTTNAAAPDAVTEEKQTPPLDVLLKDPPQIAPAILRLVVNILDAGECSSKTFQQTLVLIQNLSFLNEARDVISEELKVRAQALSKLLLPDLDELLGVIEDPDAIRGVTLAKFSPASSLQAKLLRILKTIDWIHSSLKKAASPPADTDPLTASKISAEEERVSRIYESFAFDGLWQRLGGCLAGVEARPELLYIATVLLPLIESLMVVSKYVGAKRPLTEVQSPREATTTVSTSPKPEPSAMESIFLTFTDDHRKILNTMVRNNPSLMSGSFAILVHNPKVLEFDNKRSYFFSRLHDRSQRQRGHYGTLQVNVRRQYVFEDSFHNLQRRTGDEIKNGKLNVKFYDEEGVDAGGVTREWFSVLARQMFNPGYALFQPQAADALTYQPNKSSAINPEHLSFFKFVGRIIGKALHDQRILEAYFSRSVYKHMLGKPVTHRDLESIDPEYHKSLVWMLNNDIDGVLDLTFSVERDDFGVTEIVDLIPDGRNIAVTNENKAEYVRLIADQRLSIDIKDQISALIQGLYEIIPKDLLQIFSEKELELLISGLPEIDVDEWRANTDLHNFTSTDPIIGYFWRAVRSFTMEERAKLLQFVSGSSRVPLEGFGALQGMTGIQKFSITSAGATSALPTAHTCFNQLDLPSSYPSYEALRKALLMAITEGAGSFGFV